MNKYYHSYVSKFKATNHQIIHHILLVGQTLFIMLTLEIIKVKDNLWWINLRQESNQMLKNKKVNTQNKIQSLYQSKTLIKKHKLTSKTKNLAVTHYLLAKKLSEILFLKNKYRLKKMEKGILKRKYKLLFIIKMN